MEMVVVIGIMGIVTVALLMFSSISWKNYRNLNQNVEEEEKADRVMLDFEHQTRSATQILTASTSELKFYRFFDLTSTSPTQVRYFMNGNKFEIGLTKPQGVAPNITYPAGNEQIQLIIEGITNGSTLFRYYNGNNNELTQPVNMASVRMVQLTISLDINGTSMPAPVSATTKVNLRNMKDNL